MNRPPLEDIAERYGARTGTDRLIQRLIQWALNREARVAELESVSSERKIFVERSAAKIDQLSDDVERLGQIAEAAEVVANELGGWKSPRLFIESARSAIRKRCELQARVAELEKENAQLCALACDGLGVSAETVRATVRSRMADQSGERES